VRVDLEPADFAGALTLLRDCVGGQAGQRLFTESHSFVNNDDDKTILLDSLRGFDHIVFFSRVGDQIRFEQNALPSSTMCYTLNTVCRSE